MVISRPKIWRKVNFCIFLMLESNFWIHLIFFLIFKPYLSQNVKPEKVCGQFLRFFWFVWLMKRDTWIRLSRITIIWDLVIQLQPPPTQSSKCIFYRVAATKVLWGTKQKNWFDMALTLSNSIDFYHDIEPCSIPSFCGK